MHRRILISLILLGLVACSNDLAVMSSYKDIPVVYCILSPNDPVQYLRLEKTFLGADNAWSMARRPDSIYYPDARVMLERWVDGEKKDSTKMIRVVAPVRDSGVFVSDPNYVYKTIAPIRSNSEYHLNITIPSTGTAISAITHTVDDFRIVKPESYKKNLAFSSYDNYQTVEWISAPFTRLYSLIIRFHYLEVKYGDTVNLTADWNIGQYISQNGSGGELMTADVLQRNFYKWLGNKLLPPPEYVQRLASREAIDFIFNVGGEDLYTYMEVYREDGGILKDKPVFTNIVNGIGLFSSRFEKSVAGKSLSDHSIDSLAFGIYTKNLRFADSQNDYYYNGF
jgi:hypothetical protein